MDESRLGREVRGTARHVHRRAWSLALGSHGGPAEEQHDALAGQGHLAEGELGEVEVLQGRLLVLVDLLGREPGRDFREQQARPQPEVEVERLAQQLPSAGPVLLKQQQLLERSNEL